MEQKMSHDLGMIGLGVMGKNLVLNMADHKFSIAGLDAHAEKVSRLKLKATGRVVSAMSGLQLATGGIAITHSTGRSHLARFPVGKYE